MHCQFVGNVPSGAKLHLPIPNIALFTVKARVPSQYIQSGKKRETERKKERKKQRV